jgi:uncharacterized delta-60 repeat protein
LVAELLADGSLIIGGYSYIATESAAAIMMVTPAGAVDTTFGVEGVARASFVTSSDEQVESISVANDGSIYAAISVDNSSSDLLVAKYSALGILQSAFGDSGLARVDVAGGQDITKRVQVLWDGSILLGGSAFVSNTFDLAVAKLTTDGALDSSFGVSGKTSVSLSASNDLVEAMTVTPTGNIVLAASADLGGSTSFGIARFSGAIPVTTTTTTLPAATSVPSNPSTPMTTTPENTPTTVSAPAESVVLDLPLPTQPLVADTALVVGEAVTLEFGGFVPGEFVQLIVASTPQVIATGYADSAGIIRLTGSLPAGLTNGQHSLALFAPVSGRGVRQPITIEQAVLPATGMDGDLGAYLRFALLVIVVGVFPVVLRRGRTVRQS